LNESFSVCRSLCFTFDFSGGICLLLLEQKGCVRLLHLIGLLC
jgi:hypothetical protein